MRTLTAAQRAILDSANYAVHARIEVADDFGDLQDLSLWLVSVAYGTRQDQPIPELRAELVRDASDVGTISPLIDPSRLDVGRHLRLSVATLPEGQQPVQTDYVPVFDGTTDQVQFASDPLTIVGRGTGHETGTRWVEEERTYGSEDGTPIEQVMRDILADWSPGTALEVPVVPGFNVLPYLQQPKTVQAALQQLAALIGWVVLTYWHDGSNSFRLYFVQPDRQKTAIDWTMGPSDYFAVDQLDLSVLDIRNVIQVKYSSNGTQDEVVATDAQSVQRYGRLWAEFVEGSDSPIDTQQEAQNLADAALADLSTPRAEQIITTKYGWQFEINDLIRFLPNGAHYIDPQDWAAVSIWNEFTPQSDITRITVRGKPAGNYAAWRGKERPGQQPDDDLPDPFGVVSPRVEPDGRLLFDAHGNDIGASFRWAASLTQLPNFPNMSVDAREAVDIDTGITIPQGSTAWVACWWYDQPAGAGRQGPRVGQSVTRPLDPEGTQQPYFEALRTQHADVNHIDLSGRIIDPVDENGGRFDVWVNKDGNASPDPNGPRDGTVAVNTFPFDFGPSTAFGAAGNLLQNVQYQPGTVKTVYYRYVAPSGLSTGVFAYQIDSALPIIDPDGQLKDLTVDTRNLFNEAVTNAKLGQLAVGTGNIQAESVTGVKIAARTVAAQNLLVGSWENLVANPGFELKSGTIPAPWIEIGTGGGTWARSTSEPRSGDFCMLFRPAGQTSRALLGSSNFANATECAAGDPFHVELWAQRIGAGSVFPDAGIRLRFYSAEGTTVDTFGTSRPVPFNYTRIELNATAPPGSAFVIAECSAEFASGADGNISFDDLYLRRMVQGSIIVDGAITADKVAANAIRTVHLAAGSVVADKIAVNTLAAITVDAGFLSAGRLQDAPTNSTAGIRLSSNYTLPGTWQRFVDLAATGAQAFLQHPGLQLFADGNINITVRGFANRIAFQNNGTRIGTFEARQVGASTLQFLMLGPGITVLGRPAILMSRDPDATPQTHMIIQAETIAINGQVTFDTPPIGVN